MQSRVHRERVNKSKQSEISFQDDSEIYYFIKAILEEII